MDEKTYTQAEMDAAMRDTGNAALAGSFVQKIVTQMDKNRSPRGEFTEEQVRRALRASGLTKFFIDNLFPLMRMAEKPAEPAEGGVYKSPADVLYRRSRNYWWMFGSSKPFTEENLPFPVSQMERVL